MTNVRRIGYRYQRTIARPVELTGSGFLTGAMVRVVFRPAPPSAGIVFIRTDLSPAVQVPAKIDQVSGTQRRTVLGRPPAHVGLVEHVLAALAGLRIDNCYIELNAPEPPGLDGSSRQFVDVLRSAGSVLQPERRSIWTVDAPVVVTQEGATLAIHPAEADELKISYTLHYRLPSPIGRQAHTQTIATETFAELASCRTFIFEAEVAELRRQGVGVRAAISDVLVFGPHGPIQNKLRYANEPARHKVLDIVGDLSLFGQDLRGHVVAYRSGHTLNAELVRALVRERIQERVKTAA